MYGLPQKEKKNNVGWLCWSEYLEQIYGLAYTFIEARLQTKPSNLSVQVSICLPDADYRV